MGIGVDFLDRYSSPKIISNGTVIKPDGEIVPYSIELGLSKSSITECNGWKDFLTDIIIHFAEKNPDIKDYKKELQEHIMLEDFHWDWSKKAFLLDTSEYNWFFLRTSDGIQGVCLTFHPKESVFQSVNIFYIKYIASAPWNRKSTLHKRKYNGVATEIIKQVQYYFIRKYRYKHGFSLHSLPQAQKYYEYIGMEYISGYNDENGLPFYEMNKENSILFLEGKYARNG
jgi:hypothetical protein